MKLFSLATLLALSVLLAACDSLTNPFTEWFHKRGDNRVYNPQTGQWEYPDSGAPASSPGPKRSAAVAGAIASTPAPQSAPPSDGRMFDAQKNQWVEMRNTNSSSGSDSSSSSASASPTPSAPPPPPPPAPRPQRDTGVYNPATGKIEWQSSGGTAPSYGAVVKPTPKPKANAKPNANKVKHWWWPF